MRTTFQTRNYHIYKVYTNNSGDRFIILKHSNRRRYLVRPITQPENVACKYCYSYTQAINYCEGLQSL